MFVTLTMSSTNRAVRRPWQPGLLDLDFNSWAITTYSQVSCSNLFEANRSVISFKELHYCELSREILCRAWLAPWPFMHFLLGVEFSSWASTSRHRKWAIRHTGWRDKFSGIVVSPWTVSITHPSTFRTPPTQVVSSKKIFLCVFSFSICPKVCVGGYWFNLYLLMILQFT